MNLAAVLVGGGATDGTDLLRTRVDALVASAAQVVPVLAVTVEPDADVGDVVASLAETADAVLVTAVDDVDRTAAVLPALLAALADADAAACADPVTDAVKQVASGVVAASVDRSVLALPRLPVVVASAAVPRLPRAGTAIPAAEIIPALVESGTRVRMVAAPVDEESRT